MFRAIWRQRRRILFSSFFMTLYFYLELGSDIYQIALSSRLAAFAVLATAMIFLIFGLILCAFLAVVILIFPSLRSNAELIALPMFLSSMLMYFVPPSVSEAYWWIDTLSFLILLFALPPLLYGNTLHRFPLRLRADSRRSFTSPKSAEALWAEMVPGAGTVAQHWESALRQVSQVNGNPDRLRLVYTLGGGCFMNRNIDFQSRNAPHHCLYRISGDVTARNQDVNSAEVEITITAAGHGHHRVTFTRRPDAMQPAVALEGWMDDRIGDIVDHIRAKHYGKRDWTRTGRLLADIERAA